jgi:hypothetical protein
MMRRQVDKLRSKALEICIMCCLWFRGLGVFLSPSEVLPIENRLESQVSQIFNIEDGCVSRVATGLMRWQIAACGTTPFWQSLVLMCAEAGLWLTYVDYFLGRLLTREVGCTKVLWLEGRPVCGVGL